MTAPAAQAVTEATGGGTGLDAGTYQVLRARLGEQAAELAARADALNAERLAVFGGTELRLIGTERIRTENNCVPRDIVSIGGLMLFGYNVFIGLKPETTVDDVFSVHTFTRGSGDGEDGFRFDPAPMFRDPRFERDFAELYRYYRETRLTRLRRVEGKLLAVFRTGPQDTRVLRWQVGLDGSLTYVDDRGERDHTFPPSHDFEWTPATRDDHVPGRHPHVSIEGEVFVETVGGDLTIKIENNTETGEGIYREPVTEPLQSLADAEIHHARIGPLILLRVRPYKETEWRHLVFNTRTKAVVRLDGIGQACQRLPEDQGIIFPGGYYLSTGVAKTFDADVSELEFERVIRSPNGEDVLYVFHAHAEGRSLLLPYNVIRKQVATPLSCHGYSLFDDGTMVVFRAVSDEPTRVHPMQVWQTPYHSDVHAASQPTGTGPLERIGNAELVRGVSDCLSVARMADEMAPSVPVFEALIASCDRAADRYHWLDEHGLRGPLADVRATAEQVLEEFEKVQALTRQAADALEAAAADVTALVRQSRAQAPRSAQGWIERLSELRQAQGHLVTLGEMRHIDTGRIGELDAELTAEIDGTAQRAVGFLQGEDAFAGYHAEVGRLAGEAGAIATTAEAGPVGERLDRQARGLEVVVEVVGTLDIADATARTAILERVGEVLGGVNRARATLEARRRELLASEGRASFAAEFALLGQAITGALAMSDTPERCEEQLGRLMLQLENMESRFAEFDDFLRRLAVKREDVYEAFSSRRQALLDQRARRADRLAESAERILTGVRRRVTTLGSLDEVNTYFGSDAMVVRLRGVAGELRELGDQVRAEELEGRIAAARQEAGRALRDRLDLYTDGGETIRLGRHLFAVNTQAPDLTLVPHRDGPAFAITGTDYRSPVRDPDFAGTRRFWDQLLVSESAEVYRGEHLAASILAEAESGTLTVGGNPVSLGELHKAADGDGLVEIVRRVAETRYDEGYERGVHDHDAATILGAVLRLYSGAGLLRYPAGARAAAQLFWAFGTDEAARVAWTTRATSLARARTLFGRVSAVEETRAALGAAIAAFARRLRDDAAGITGTTTGEAGKVTAATAAGTATARHDRTGGTGGTDGVNDTGDVDGTGVFELAGEYLFEELASRPFGFVTSTGARSLLERFDRALGPARGEFDDDLRALGDDLARRYRLAEAWLGAFDASVTGSGRVADAATGPGPASGSSPGSSPGSGPVSGAATGPATVGDPAGDPARGTGSPELAEAVAALLCEVPRHESQASLITTVEGLLGTHPRVAGRVLELRLDEFLARTRWFREHRAPAYRAYQRRRNELIAAERERLRLEEFRPKVMNAFVRNQLLDEVYLPLIGDNLAKQLGAAGDARRTDQNGLLLLISPPGYGKTTLMEYVASRLGLVFVKVNGPALGHLVTSLDPAEAPDATARQEVEKISFALEMGNNVLLYLDDIQHTSPELLQRFISLCDGQRRMEGVWEGRSRTYDLRGKRFAVCMAGNPYTESGGRFRIPDMLANRADVWNLGEVLSGREELFALSYIDNALTSNPVLAPLSTRDRDDVRLLVRLARGDAGVRADRLSHPYSPVELEQILAVLRKLLRIQRVVLANNQAYIASAAQSDASRTEPPFQLQGSYRNMNKLAARVVPVMNDAELEAVIDDHYLGEAQTLTSGAEANLLKLAELRGTMTAGQAERWAEVKAGYLRARALGGSGDDPVNRAVGAVGLLADQVSSAIERAADRLSPGPARMVADVEYGERVPVGDRRPSRGHETEREQGQQ
ncbi:MoxR-like ATPase [Streptosporangium becharense]|uniref:MoxR-like ATPase n=1 Tax=Streptosporangium becharense TaxID=1816182 RepID=A0A7W9IER4_9ACTN|nr:DNA repair ATPase [Streptosporangium becharense]MBB2909879.1 MoxR-like ATPase [Streptosporangium becharense]MBB5819166.1 MoxR-like ATPase [Streptosporangium becharense]